MRICARCGHYEEDHSRLATSSEADEARGDLHTLPGKKHSLQDCVALGGFVAEGSKEMFKL